MYTNWQRFFGFMFIFLESTSNTGTPRKETPEERQVSHQTNRTHLTFRLSFGLQGSQPFPEVLGF